MQYSQSSGYNISKLTLGTVQLGLNYSLNTPTKPDINQSWKMLDFALKAGINTLDTALQQALESAFQDVPESIITPAFGINNQQIR